MSSFCYSHFFNKKFEYICVSLDLNFNESLTNDVVSFEQLGPVLQIREVFMGIPIALGKTSTYSYIGFMS